MDLNTRRLCGLQCVSLRTLRGGHSSACTYVMLVAGTRVRLRVGVDTGESLGTQVVFGRPGVGTLAEADIRLKVGRSVKSSQKGWLGKDI